MTDQLTPEDVSDDDRVVLMEQTFSAVDEVCSRLRPEQWDLPTDCPGWSVKDNLSHLASFEAVAAGRPAAPADIDVSHIAHVSNDFAAMNEREVEIRRANSGEEILEEFRTVTGERLKQLADLDAFTWDSELRTPVGTMQQRSALAIRILDVFYHEQDIRRATGNPGHLDGDVARFIYAWMSTRALPRISGKNSPEGSTIVFDVAHPAWPVCIATLDGKGVPAQETDAAPTVRLGCDLETILCLLGGRWTPQRARNEGRLTIEGDEEIAGRILDAIVVVP